MTTRAEVIAAARRFIGTPYQHQQRMPGVAIDCAGVVICAGRELGLLAPDFDVTGYSRQPDGTLVDYCERYMTRLEPAAMQAGDVVVIRFDGEPQHFGILAPYRYGGLSIIHAVSGRAVIETRLLFGTAAAAMKFVAAYRLPGIAA